MSNNASGPFPSPLTTQTSSLAKRQVELLARYFFSRTDAVAASMDGNPPQPVSPSSPLEELLATHVCRRSMPTAKVATRKKGSHGFWSGHYRPGSSTPNEDGTTAWLCLDFDGKGSGTKKGKGHSAKGIKLFSILAIPQVEPITPSETAARQYPSQSGQSRR